MAALFVRATFAALAVLTLGAAPAQAQWGARANGAQTEGYRDGVRAGNDDARDGRRYDYQRHRDYRSADTGYQSRDGRRDDYREQYRAGFVAGYRDGFYSSGRRPSSGNGGPWNGGGPWNDRGDGRGGRVVLDVARRNGAADGYERGFDDGRDRDRYDVRQHGRYRDGDRGYRRDYGPRALYRDAYRNAFERAYRDGYDDGRGNRRR